MSLVSCDSSKTKNQNKIFSRSLIVFRHFEIFCDYWRQNYLFLLLRTPLIRGLTKDFKKRQPMYTNAFAQKLISLFDNCSLHFL